MARSSEKALSNLSRFTKLQAEGDNKRSTKRPYLAELCTDLHEAEKWRKDVIQEIDKYVSLIQNPGLGEFKIRDLNDHINKLLRIKRHWERRIIELGGPNLLARGEEARKYQYFGAARDLPGVKELFAVPTKEVARKTREELLRNVDIDYFGYRDEDDGVLLPLEFAAETKARAQALSQWHKDHDQ